MLLKRLDYLKYCGGLYKLYTNLCLVNYKKYIVIRKIMYTYDYNVNKVICAYFSNAYPLLFIQVLHFFWIN